MNRNIVSYGYNSEFYSFPNIVFGPSNVINSAFGENGKTFNSTQDEIFTSGDISNIFKDISENTISGNYCVAIKTETPVPAYVDGQDPNQVLGPHTGYVSMIANITGYMSYE